MSAGGLLRLVEAACRAMGRGLDEVAARKVAWCGRRACWILEGDHPHRTELKHRALQAAHVKVEGAGRARRVRFEERREARGDDAWPVEVVAALLEAGATVARLRLALTKCYCGRWASLRVEGGAAWMEGRPAWLAAEAARRMREELGLGESMEAVKDRLLQLLAQRRRGATAAYLAKLCGADREAVEEELARLMMEGKVVKRGRFYAMTAEVRRGLRRSLFGSSPSLSPFTEEDRARLHE